MLDSFTNSSFSKEFMGVENPAAVDLATLGDTIYAGRLGFSEHVPTKAAWGGGGVVQSGPEEPRARFFLGYGTESLDRVAPGKWLQHFYWVFQ